MKCLVRLGAYDQQRSQVWKIETVGAPMIRHGAFDSRQYPCPTQALLQLACLMSVSPR